MPQSIYLRMLDARLFRISACFCFSSPIRLCRIWAYSFCEWISQELIAFEIVGHTAASLARSALRRLSAILCLLCWRR